jgi:DNA polymerase I
MDTIAPDLHHPPGSFLAVDFETGPIGFFDKKARGLLTWKAHPRLAIPEIATWSDGRAAWLSQQPALRLPKLPFNLVFHNVAFDLCTGTNGGLFSEDTPTLHKLHCTALMARLWRNDRSSRLKDLARSELGATNTVHYEDAVSSSRATFETYAEMDALFTAQLFPILAERLKSDGLWHLYESVELPFALLNLECQRNGIQVDSDALKAHALELKRRMAEIESTLADGSINWDSPKQLQGKLFGEWELPLTLLNGRPSTAKHSLAKLANDCRVRQIIQRKELQSQLRQLESLSRFIEPASSRVHPYIHTLGADTGRCTSSCPNLQNINKSSTLRALFVAPPGATLLVLDFSQIEPRVLGHFVHGGSFANLFAENGDFYTRLARDLFTSGRKCALSRAVAKQVVLATLYGMGGRTLAANLGVSPLEASGFLEAFFDAFPEVGSFRDKAISEARVRGFTVGLLGRRRYIHGLSHQDPYERQRSERKVLNAIIQGSACTLFKLKLVKLRERLSRRVRFLLHVHDEVILETPLDIAEESLSLAKSVLEEPEPWFSVPLRVDGGIGATWATAKGGGSM